MFFGPKVACDQCNTKVKEAKSLYRRGSRFCSEKCVLAWEAANPPPVARGTPDALRAELVMLLDEAFAENGRPYNPTFGANVGGVQISVGTTHRVGQPPGMMAGIDQRHAAEEAQTRAQLFQTYVLRSAPILRALGYANEASMIDGTDFTQGYSNKLVAALRGVRGQL
jgi:hypothetical protein